MRALSTLLILLVCAVGCQGPISDWPHSSGGDKQDSPAGGNGPSAAQPPVSLGGAGGATNGSNPAVSTPATPGGTTAGTSAGGTTAGTSLGGTTGGSSSAPPDAGAGVPTASADAGSAILDAGSYGGGAPLDGGGAAPDAGVGDAHVPDAASDAGCAPLSAAGDAGMCPGYGCRATMQQLRLALDMEGACTSNHALAVACEGRASNAALQCTQDNIFSLSLDSAISSCLKRDPQLAMLGTDCLDCFVDEALCTLSRCFAVCTIADGAACQACRHQQCSAPLALCTGLPAP